MMNPLFAYIDSVKTKKRITLKAIHNLLLLQRTIKQTNRLYYGFMIHRQKKLF